MKDKIDWYAAPEGDLEWNGGFVRQGYFVYLADRYEITGDDKYANAMIMLKVHFTVVMDMLVKHRPFSKSLEAWLIKKQLRQM